MTPSDSATAPATAQPADAPVLASAAVPAGSQTQAAPAPAQPAAASGSGVPLPQGPIRAIGQALRQLREARGLSPAEVSARLKFSARQIQALEAERWEDLPKGVSLRGLVRNYARLLGADPDALTAALDPQIHAPARAPTLARVVPPSHGGMLHQEERAGGSVAWIVVILAVLAAAVGYAVWQGWLPVQWLSFDWLSPAAS